MSTQLSVISQMATRFEMEPKEFESTIKKTVFPGNGTHEQFLSFLLVAKEYNLNPLLKEIYAFPGKSGGIVPVVGIDGWLNITNSHPQFDGMEFVDVMEDGKIAAITCKIYRKDRKHPTQVTEYLSECQGATDPWKRFPLRMLRHKATIQCARYAFGFSGIVDEDEVHRLDYPGAINATATTTPANSGYLAQAIEEKKTETVDMETGEIFEEREKEDPEVYANSLKMDIIGWKDKAMPDNYRANVDKFIANNFKGLPLAHLEQWHAALAKLPE